MKFPIVLALTLMALGSIAEKSKGRKTFFSKLRKINYEQLLEDQDAYDQDNDEEAIDSEPMNNVQPAFALRPDSSSGRLFFKKIFKGKQTQRPQIIIITQKPSATDLPFTDTATSPISVTFNGTVSTGPAGRGGDELDDYVYDDDDEVEDEILDQKSNTKNKQPVFYKLIKSDGDQQKLNIVVPSKYMRNYQNKPKAIALNPSGTYNGDAIKVKKLLLNNNGNIKRKASRKPARRFFIKQN